MVSPFLHFPHSPVEILGLWEFEPSLALRCDTPAACGSSSVTCVYALGNHQGNSSISYMHLLLTTPLPSLQQHAWSFIVKRHYKNSLSFRKSIRRHPIPRREVSD